ncbi:MAG: hypothetical protein ABW250_27735 [Pyrinomonadaceae bacterium]
MTQQMQNAIEKAKQTKCAVKLFSGRTYLVTTPEGHSYKVSFHMHDGLRYGYCNCRAASFNRPCFHIPTAAVLDTAIQKMRGH